MRYMSARLSDCNYFINIQVLPRPYLVMNGLCAASRSYTALCPLLPSILSLVINAY